MLAEQVERIGAKCSESLDDGLSLVRKLRDAEDAVAKIRQEMLRHAGYFQALQDNFKEVDEKAFMQWRSDAVFRIQGSAGRGRGEESKEPGKSGIPGSGGAAGP